MGLFAGKTSMAVGHLGDFSGLGRNFAREPRTGVSRLDALRTTRKQSYRSHHPWPYLLPHVRSDRTFHEGHRTGYHEPPAVEGYRLVSRAENGYTDETNGKTLLG